MAFALRLFVGLLPTVVAILYFGLLARDRYVAEAQFVVRTAAKPSAMLGFGALLQATGLVKSQDDVHSVQSFITSRNAVEELRKRLPLAEIYGKGGIDFVASYPSFAYGRTQEELHAYLKWMVTTTHNTTTGITTLQVQAFTAEDARAVASTLLDLGEKAVNDLNTRGRTDSLRLAEREVQRAEQRLVAAQVEITRFRNSETTIDPANSLVILTETIARLSAELTQTEAQLREITSAATSNPQLPSLQRRAVAIQQQIERERERIASGAGGLAQKLAVYERMVLDREFAKQALATAVKGLESSQTEARRQQLYLERIVEPLAADVAMAPQRLRHIASSFGLNLIALLLYWLIYGGVREHGVTKEA